MSLKKLNHVEIYDFCKKNYNIYIYNKHSIHNPTYLSSDLFTVGEILLKVA